MSLCKRNLSLGDHLFGSLGTADVDRVSYAT